MLETQIQQAIQAKSLVHFYYDDLPRKVEPHVLGLKSGTMQFLGFQVGGASRSGGVPDWRRFDLYRVDRLQTVNIPFSGPRPAPSGRHSHWDHIIEVVR
jgi:hypothetical protein